MLQYTQKLYTEIKNFTMSHNAYIMCLQIHSYAYNVYWINAYPLLGNLYDWSKGPLQSNMLNGTANEYSNIKQVCEYCLQYSNTIFSLFMSITFLFYIICTKIVIM